MANKTILRVGQILSFERRAHMSDDEALRFSRAIEQAILQSPEIQALRKDKERLDWLAGPNNNIGNVQLPRVCVERNLHSLRDAIDDAMEREND